MTDADGWCIDEEDDDGGALCTEVVVEVLIQHGGHALILAVVHQSCGRSIDLGQRRYIGAEEEAHIWGQRRYIKAEEGVHIWGGLHA